MKTGLILVSALVLAGLASADGPPGEKPPMEDVVQLATEPCVLEVVAYDWDFSVSDHGFSTVACNSAARPVWEYGIASHITTRARACVWGTVLAGEYPNRSGEGLVSPSFTVGPGSDWMEVTHHFQIEAHYDGCNITVAGQVIEPQAGYTVEAGGGIPVVISKSDKHETWCVDLEHGWTGRCEDWRTECFDLSGFTGEEVTVRFDFGSDASVTALGWYIGQVRIGGALPAETDGRTWGKIKNMFK